MNRISIVLRASPGWPAWSDDPGAGGAGGAELGPRVLETAPARIDDEVLAGVAPSFDLDRDRSEAGRGGA